LGHRGPISVEHALSLPFQGHQIEIHTIGIRGVNFPKDLSTQDLTATLLAGLGGGLDPSLEIGDVVIDGLAHSGGITSSDHLVGSVAQKRDLFQQTGAQVVEMEGNRVRQWSKTRAVPFIGIRSVSDRADQVLDGRVLSWVDDFGRPKWARLLSSLLRKPHLIRPLWQLGQNGRRACATLGPAVREVLITLVQPQSHCDPPPAPIHPPH